MILAWIMLILNSVCLCVISFTILFWKNPLPAHLPPVAGLLWEGAYPEVSREVRGILVSKQILQRPDRDQVEIW